METVIVSLGGSVVIQEKINVLFLKQFYACLLKLPYRFIICVGGGLTARKYQEAGDELGVDNEGKDWLGIAAINLNAELVRLFFKTERAKNVEHPQQFSKVLVSGAWNPGSSSDYVSVLLAQTYGAKKIINLTLVDYVYDTDPRSNPHAKKYERLNWSELQKIVGDDWTPGKHTPFDAVATKKAKELGLTLALLGPSVENFENYILNKEWKGTLVKP